MYRYIPTTPVIDALKSKIGFASHYHDIHEDTAKLKAELNALEKINEGIYKIIGIPPRWLGDKPTYNDDTTTKGCLVCSFWVCMDVPRHNVKRVNFPPPFVITEVTVASHIVEFKLSATFSEIEKEIKKVSPRMSAKISAKKQPITPKP